MGIFYDEYLNLMQDEIDARLSMVMVAMVMTNDEGWIFGHINVTLFHKATYKVQPLQSG